MLTIDVRLLRAVVFADWFGSLVGGTQRVRFAMFREVFICIAPSHTRGGRHRLVASYRITRLYCDYYRRVAGGIDFKFASVDAPPFAGTSMPEDAPVHSIAAAGTSSGISVDVLGEADEADASHDSGTTELLVDGRLDGPLVIDVTKLPLSASTRFRAIRGRGPFSVDDPDGSDVSHFREVELSVGGTGRCEVTMPPAAVGGLMVGAT